MHGSVARRLDNLAIRGAAVRAAYDDRSSTVTIEAAPFAYVSD